MDYTEKEVLQFVRENDVKFIRLAFCDIFGNLKNISIMAEELPKAFEHGISFDASAIRGFLNVEDSDLLLYPDPGTLEVLPWRPQQGRVARFYCSIRHPDGTPFAGDLRNALKDSAQRAIEMGFRCKIGSECEFYLFETDENGAPTNIPFDNAGYLDVAPMDKGENVRREICLTLEEMGIFPESSHHEQGPGQNEIVFRYSDALQAADNLITFKSVVKTIAARSGLYASFLPKPIPNRSGTGLHLNISLHKNGFNIFKNDPYEHSQEAESFIAGVLDKAREMTLFLNPLTNSYERLGKFEAPKYVSWSHQNRSQLIRIPAAGGEYSRMELRSPDPSCNPYLAFLLILEAGMQGITSNLSLCKPANLNLYQADKEQLAGFAKLPSNLGEAIEAALDSRFVRNLIEGKTFEKLIGMKQEEWERYQLSNDRGTFEKETYFYHI
ncbi:glutamine synthetase family protein [Acetivibrio sp. MSJd-27]|uniref:glutamine synthetase family protein n=1 Tax=Acetivibrio sp. MSJd-27 TaxID=2841523 RepID=UPI0015AE1380|nr:glutamine synthetase family protein [Acetivibrio sp. MSJd-27]MBU5451131.1 glutamine synthetase family protein [Acetivibrio sp. MSJd-27]